MQACTNKHACRHTLCSILTVLIEHQLVKEQTHSRERWLHEVQPLHQVGELLSQVSVELHHFVCAPATVTTLVLAFIMT